MASAEPGKPSHLKRREEPLMDKLMADKRLVYGGLAFLVVLLVGFLASEHAALQKERAAIEVEVTAGKNKADDEAVGININDSRDDEDFAAKDTKASGEVTIAGAGASPEVADESTAVDGPSACRDKDDECAEWAKAGECVANPGYMVGDEQNEGVCRLACGVCKPDGAGAAGEPGKPSVPDDGGVGAGSDSGADVEAAATDGLGAAAAQADDASSKGVKAAAECRDLSPNCERWARAGECAKNADYMVGGDGYEGQCVLSCGACPGAEGPKAVSEEPDRPPRIADHTLKWPAKRTDQGHICVGLTTSACVRGLFKPEVQRLKANDRSVASGAGGPTGCNEAYATLLTRDDQLPGALVLIYSIRKFATVDRDIVVFVSMGITQSIIAQLQTACVVVKRVTEPFDPTTHVGFTKLSMWLAVDYAKLVFFDPDAWVRKDPGDMFTFEAPAAVKAPPHPRVINEVYNSAAMVVEPSRKTFFDMLAKVGIIDSVERIGNATVNTDRLFLTGYFDQWTTMSSDYMEVLGDTVTKIVPELTNLRIRHVIKSMPPYTPNTVLDFAVLNAGGVHVDTSVKPWSPGWRIPCSWECRYRKYQSLYEAVVEEWWLLYYDMCNVPQPTDRGMYSLLEVHDPFGMFNKKEYEFCLDYDCTATGAISTVGAGAAELVERAMPNTRKAKKAKGLRKLVL